MAWIRTVAPADAAGVLRRVYDAALRRAGKVFNVIRIQSLRPHTLQASTRLSLEVMHSGRSGLTRAQREMIATAVSRANGCHYWTEAHGEDLRVEIQKVGGSEALAEAVMTDYRTAELTAADRAMLDFAVRLTEAPSRMGAGDLDPLRAQGFDDAGILDIVQVTALFNYYNRLAEGLGIDPEPG